jgi:hypothetical protein
MIAHPKATDWTEEILLSNLRIDTMWTLPHYSADFWIVAAMVMIPTGISKAGFSVAASMLLTPLLSLTINVSEAAMQKK